MKKKAVLFNTLSDKKVKCLLCAHKCIIIAGKHGICGVRKNEAGVLFTTAYGNVVAQSPDPIEKKPLYHFLPGTISYSIAIAGCNFKCRFCQNWQISQFIDAASRNLFPEDVIASAIKESAKSISYTYTEPTIFFEYCYDTAKLASSKGIKNIFVTNGFMTPQALEMIGEYLDAANVDLKYFSDSSYKKVCGGRLQPVLDAIKKMVELKIWVEITTLLIPGENDSDDEIKDIASFIASVDVHIPWHISRFFPQYKYNSEESTPLRTMKRAEEIGRDAGLKYIYPGNVSGQTITFCHACGEELIVRSSYVVEKNKIRDGKCIKCGEKIKGVWCEA